MILDCIWMSLTDFFFLVLLKKLHIFSSGCEETKPQNCTIQLVESIPEGLVYNSTVKHLSTYKV